MSNPLYYSNPSYYSGLESTLLYYFGEEKNSTKNESTNGRLFDV